MCAKLRSLICRAAPSMQNQRHIAPLDSSVYHVLCMLLPEPPRVLHLTSLSKLSRRGLPWLATLLVHSTVVMVPALLWCAAGMFYAINRDWLLTLQQRQIRYRMFAGSKRVAVPGTSAVLHPSKSFYPPAVLLIVYLLLAHAAVQYLKAVRQREADLADTALTPESIIGTTSDWQEAWPTDNGQGVPQGDASSLPVDRSMQQPRDHIFEEDTDSLFSNICVLKKRLYGGDADVSTKGKHDLATAAAEIDRLVRAEFNYAGMRTAFVLQLIMASTPASFEASLKVQLDSSLWHICHFLFQVV